MSKPNFFIVGAPKCGTTAWVQYLRTHPDIFISEIKEPHYFASDLPKFRRIGSASDYARLFRRTGAAKAVGEASVMYLYSDAAARAIHEYNPDARIIVFLRAQEDFLPSLHHQYLYNFRETKGFEEAWRMSGNRPSESIPPQCGDAKLLNYVALGAFREQVQRYLDLFPPEQIRVFFFDEWTKDPRHAYVQLLEFLEVEDDGRTEFPRLNVAKTHRSTMAGRFIFHPPPFARSLVEFVKKITGKPSLGLARRAAKLIEAPGYTTKINEEVRQEIREYYLADNVLLKEELPKVTRFRPDTATRPE